MISAKPPMYDRFFLDNLELIERAIRFACRRYGCWDEIDDIRQTVHEKLIENDYGRLRAWEGRSALPTFLTTIVQRLVQDYLIALRGKRRPSEEAKRLGPVAMRLEELLRERPVHEAVEILRRNFQVDFTVEQLEELAGRLPRRTGRRMEGEEQLAALPSSEPPPDERLREQEAAARWTRVRAALDRARTHLPPDDQLFLKMYFEDGFKISVIARTTCQDQKKLYPRKDRILALLRQELEVDGIRWEDVAEILDGAGKGGPESV